MFEAVSQGQPVRFSARQYNSWNRSAEAFQNGDTTKTADRPRKMPLSPVLIRIQNKSEQNVNLFGILRIDAPVSRFDDDTDVARNNALNQSIIFEAKKPTGVDSETICIVLHPAKKDGITSAMIVGPIYCVVDIMDTDHRYARPIGGDVEKLESCESGTIRILTKPTAKGKAFCYIFLGSGAASEKNLTGVIMKSVPHMIDTTVEIPDDNEMGEIRIDGKNYPAKDEGGNPIEPKYDKIICDELAKDEYLLAGMTDFEIAGPFSKKPPKKENDENDPEPITYYKAKKIPRIYQGLLNGELRAGGSTTFTVGTSKESRNFPVYCYLLEDGDYLPAGSGVDIERRPSADGPRLFVVNGPCFKEG